jgi:CRP-like cAMP-binding protein
MAPDRPRRTICFWSTTSVRVQQVSEGGREIVLYRVSAGESCALTTACLMGYEDYLAEAVAETDVRAVAIPRATFDDLIARSPEFRRFVFTAFSRRVTDLFHVIEEIVFFPGSDQRFSGHWGWVRRSPPGRAY